MVSGALRARKSLVCSLRVVVSGALRARKNSSFFDTPSVSRSQVVFLIFFDFLVKLNYLGYFFLKKVIPEGPQ